MSGPATGWAAAVRRWWSSPAPTAQATTATVVMPFVPGKPPVPVQDLDRAAEVLKQYSTRANSPWDEFRDRYLALPDWYDASLDPFSPDYAAQQDRIWQWVAGRSSYSAVEQEQTPEAATQEHIYKPAFYVLRAPGTMATAGQHLIATGHFLKHSGIVARQRVLEYGAGYGQTALAFARMGAIVDTVDINPFFCNAVQAQGEFFKVKLTAFIGEFGDNPRLGEKYRLIFFYEAFHHSRDFMGVIAKLRDNLADDGKILLGGEPITTDPNSPSIPYPWGLRLDVENAAVVRWRGWYELGFHEDFLVKCFIRQGFSYRKHPCEVADFAILYEFRPRAAVIEMADEQLAPADAASWHGLEANGRWTRAQSTLTLDARGRERRLSLTAINHHPLAIAVQFSIGSVRVEQRFEPRERLTLALCAPDGAQLDLRCTPLSPSSYGSADARLLGIFVERIVYAD